MRLQQQQSTGATLNVRSPLLHSTTHRGPHTHRSFDNQAIAKCNVSLYVDDDRLLGRNLPLNTTGHWCSLGSRPTYVLQTDANRRRLSPRRVAIFHREKRLSVATSEYQIHAGTYGAHPQHIRGQVREGGWLGEGGCMGVGALLFYIAAQTPPTWPNLRRRCLLDRVLTT